MRMHSHGSHIREHVELTAQFEQPRLATMLTAQVVPRRAADRTEQHSVRIATGIERLVGQRGAVLVDGAPTDDVDIDADLRVSSRAHAGKDAERGVDHLGADPVARQHDDIRCHAVASVRLRSGIHAGRCDSNALIASSCSSVKEMSSSPSRRRLRTNGSRWKPKRRSPHVTVSVTRSTATVIPGCSVARSIKSRTSCSGSGTGTSPLPSALVLKMSPKDSEIPARMPWSASAHPACSRDEPQPKLRPVTSTVPALYSSWLSTKSGSRRQSLKRNSP